MTETPSLYQRAGGTAFFEALVERFYAGVASDPLLRPIYPEPDLAPAQRRLTLFLIQYWAARPRTTTSAATPVCGCATRRSPSGPRRAIAGWR